VRRLLVCLARSRTPRASPGLRERLHHPHVEDGAAFAAWSAGRTGYPIVDAAMVQLNTTGWMHNSLRMIVASFYTRNICSATTATVSDIFSSGSLIGNDAAPNFRIFNPTRQGTTFDRRSCKPSATA
jgi:deoxyribodipyrimidine photo-lyase